MNFDLRKKRVSLLIITLCLLAMGFVAPNAVWADRTAKNVIVLMTDGTGSTHTTITRWYKGEALNMDKMFLAGVRTYSADSLITDSAPAATAFATGYKTNDKYVGVLPDPSKITIPGVPAIPADWKERPVATVLEGAKMMGKASGLVATSNIQHASPAGYSAHWPSRSAYNEIAEQQVYLDIDVVFGGGKKYLVPTSEGGARTDGENLIHVLKSRGYGFVENRADMLSFNGKKVWGMFADNDMLYDFDRSAFNPDQPSLAEMTKKAIEILSQNPRGFFLFVEGSKVDWASHANDPIGVISDILAFDEAVGAALDFASSKGNTLVLVFSDHGNGGMSLGSKKTDSTYSKLPLKALVDPLKKAKLTGEGVEMMLAGDLSTDNIRKVMGEQFGIEDLTGDEITAIQSAAPGNMNSVVGPMISSRSVIGWTTNGHGGEDLFFYYYGMRKPMGLVENTDIAHMSANFMNVDLRKADKSLFIPADELFGRIGATIAIDSTDPANPALVVQKNYVKATIPFSKDLLICNGAPYQMPGITVYAPNTGKVYLPEAAMQLFQYCRRWK